MKRSIAAVAVTASIITAGTAAYLGGALPAFAAKGRHVEHVARAKTADTMTVGKFQWGPYVIIVRYLKNGPLPKRFPSPTTLSAATLQRATVSELATLQRSYKSLAKDCIQVYMPKSAAVNGSKLGGPAALAGSKLGSTPASASGSKSPTSTQRLWVHSHTHLNTGFGGEAHQVEHHFPAGYRSARR